MDLTSFGLGVAATLLGAFVSHVLTKQRSSSDRLHELGSLLQYVDWQLQELELFFKSPGARIQIPLESIRHVIERGFLMDLPQELKTQLLAVKSAAELSNLNTGLVEQAQQAGLADWVTRFQDSVTETQRYIAKEAPRTVTLIRKYLQDKEPALARLATKVRPPNVRAADEVKSEHSAAPEA